MVKATLNGFPQNCDAAYLYQALFHKLKWVTLDDLVLDDNVNHQLIGKLNTATANLCVIQIFASHYKSISTKMTV